MTIPLLLHIGEHHPSVITGIPSNKPPLVADGCKTRGGLLLDWAKSKKTNFVKDLYRLKIFGASRRNGCKTRGGLLLEIPVIGAMDVEH